MSTEQMHYKVILVGDGATGKTTFLQRLFDNIYVDKYVPTLGAEGHSLLVSTSIGPVHLQVHDCAGQEKFTGMRDAYYIGANACLLFFDTTAISTYVNSKNWYNDVITVTNRIPMVLVGNKIDIVTEHKKAVTVWQEKHNIPFVQISVKKNQDCELPLLLILRMLTKNDDLTIRSIEKQKQDENKLKSKFNLQGGYSSFQLNNAKQNNNIFKAQQNDIQQKSNQDMQKQKTFKEICEKIDAGLQKQIDKLMDIAETLEEDQLIRVVEYAKKVQQEKE